MSELTTVRALAVPPAAGVVNPAAARPARPPVLATDTRAALTRGMQQLRYQLMRTGVMGSSGIAALVLALAAVLTVWLPAHRAELALRAELMQASSASGGGHVPGSAEHPLAALPSRAQVPAVVAQILAQADQAGVTLEQGHYSYRPPQNGAPARYSLDFPVKADYSKVRDFIDRTLTAVPAAAVDKLHIERKSVGDPLIHADIDFALYLREG